MHFRKAAIIIAAAAMALPAPVGAACSCAAPQASPLSESALIKGSGPAVYYYFAGKRYVFPNEKTYFSWYDDYSAVRAIPDDELASYEIGGNVTYKPGVKLLKIQTDPRVYAVANRSILRWVTSEELASDIYGANWAAKIHDVPDAFFADYEIGRPVIRAAEYDPSWEIYTDLSVSDLMLSQADPLDLPSDVPIYPGGSVAGVTAYDPAGRTGAILLRSRFSAESAVSWYEDHASEYGWVPVEPSLMEQVLSTEGYASTKFRRDVEGQTYFLSVSYTGSSILVSRTEASSDVDLSVIPNFVPVYDRGELLSAGELDEGVAGYFAVSEEPVNDAFAFMDARMQSLSWREIERADPEKGVIRRYERMFGSEMKNLVFIAVQVGDAFKVTFIVVMYGAPDILFEDASLSDIRDSFNAMGDLTE
jgi:hypothetical protein